MVANMMPNQIRYCRRIYPDIVGDESIFRPLLVF